MQVPMHKLSHRKPVGVEDSRIHTWAGRVTAEELQRIIREAFDPLSVNRAPELPVQV